MSIAHADGAAIYVPSADKVFITTAAGSANALENGGSYTAMDDNNIDGVIFSKCDLTLNGAGSLSIQAAEGHGVVSKDDLVVTSGSYTITAASQGLSGKDSVATADGTFVLDTGKDAIQSDNTEDADKGYVYLAGGDYTITSQGDGVSASGWLWVAGGSYTVSTGGGSENGEDHTQAQTPGDMGGMGGRRTAASPLNCPQICSRRGRNSPLKWPKKQQNPPGRQMPPIRRLIRRPTPLIPPAPRASRREPAC